MVVQRIKEYIDYKGITIASFERSINMSNSSFGKSLKNNGNIGSDKLETILRIYYDLSADWLLTGKGEMLRTAYKNKEPEHQLLAEEEQEYKQKEAQTADKESNTRESRELVDYLKDKVTELEERLYKPDPTIELILKQLSEKDQEIGRLRGKLLM